MGVKGIEKADTPLGAIHRDFQVQEGMKKWPAAEAAPSLP